MKSIHILLVALALTACSRRHPASVITLAYEQADIQLQFDTLYNHQQTDSVYNGFIEQALAFCNDSTVTQHVFSSMYFNRRTRVYDCLTTTVFRLKDGTITATGIFSLTPGDTIAPDHDFPITGGSATYRNITGTYTRKYRDGVYHVELSYHKKRRFTRS